jgi:UDP-glucose 4-epimerase
VNDCAAGLVFVLDKTSGPFDVFNLAPPDATSVARLAELCVAGSPHKRARIEYSGGAQGWRGDVPTSRLKADKLNALGFRLRFTSDEAAAIAVREVAREVFGTSDV